MNAPDTVLAQPLRFQRPAQPMASARNASAGDTSTSDAPWAVAAVAALFELPFAELLHRAQIVHRQHFDPTEVELATLLSVKTGGCPEDCGYCPQSAHHPTGVAAELVRVVKDEGLEACATLGMLEPHHAQALQQAGLDYYNHNLDTSPDFYGDVITTRDYQDRLDTLQHVRQVGVKVCSGGIVGMGESRLQRAGLIAQLANLQPHPESVPINHLVKVPGTPLADQPDLDPIEFVRTIAVARITMPTARVRLSAGRRQMSDETQALCFAAGANSIFYGDKLLVTGNPDVDADRELLARLGMKAVGLQGLAV